MEKALRKSLALFVAVTLLVPPSAYGLRIENAGTEEGHTDDEIRTALLGTASPTSSPTALAAGGMEERQVEMPLRLSELEFPAKQRTFRLSEEGVWEPRTVFKPGDSIKLFYRGVDVKVSPADDGSGSFLVDAGSVAVGTGPVVIPSDGPIEGVIIGPQKWIPETDADFAQRMGGYGYLRADANPILSGFSLTRVRPIAIPRVHLQRSSDLPGSLLIIRRVALDGKPGIGFIRTAGTTPIAVYTDGPERLREAREQAAGGAVTGGLEAIPEPTRKRLVELGLDPSNLQGANLTDANLTGDNLTDANLTDANLFRANLFRAKLIRAKLIRANLFRANLTDADLTGADLTGATLTGANLTGANLIRANLFRANLTDATLTGANLIRANLTDATLTGANLTGANLTDADLFRANLTGATLTGATLTGANLTGAILPRGFQPPPTTGGMEAIPEPTRKRLVDLGLNPDNLRGADLSGKDLSGIDLTGVDLTGINLTEAYLIGAKLTNANLTRAKLNHANLAYADLTGTNLTDAYLNLAKLTDADLSHADLTRAELTDINLVRANLVRTNLTDAYLSRAKLTGANLTGANLTNTYLVDAKTAGATFSEGFHPDAPALEMLPESTRKRLAELGLNPDNLRGADLSGKDLSDIDLTGADLTGINLTDANLTHAKLTGTKLTDADLVGANLAYADLTDTDLVGANLAYADLTGANLAYANLIDAKLIDANLTGANLNFVDLARADLSGKNLSGIDFVGANLTDANLTNANLTRANLLGANLCYTYLTGANLIRANLTTANLAGADLTGTDLIGANLTLANLTLVDLTGANLTNADLTGADLIDADLTDAKLLHTILIRVKLTGAKLPEDFRPGVGGLEAKDGDRKRSQWNDAPASEQAGRLLNWLRSVRIGIVASADTAETLSAWLGEYGSGRTRPFSPIYEHFSEIQRLAQEGSLSAIVAVFPAPGDEEVSWIRQTKRLAPHVPIAVIYSGNRQAVESVADRVMGTSSLSQQAVGDMVASMLPSDPAADMEAVDAKVSEVLRSFSAEPNRARRLQLIADHLPHWTQSQREQWMQSLLWIDQTLGWDLIHDAFAWDTLPGRVVRDGMIATVRDDQTKDTGFALHLVLTAGPPSGVKEVVDRMEAIVGAAAGFSVEAGVLGVPADDSLREATLNHLRKKILAADGGTELNPAPWEQMAEIHEARMEGYRRTSGEGSIEARFEEALSGLHLYVAAEMRRRLELARGEKPSVATKQWRREEEKFALQLYELLRKGYSMLLNKEEPILQIHALQQLAWIEELHGHYLTLYIGEKNALPHFRQAQEYRIAIQDLRKQQRTALGLSDPSGGLEAIPEPTRKRLAELGLDPDNLRGANLSGKNLARLDLTGANLTGADLTDANLTGATLPYVARMRGVLWDESTRWPDGFDPNSIPAGGLEARQRGIGATLIHWFLEARLGFVSAVAATAYYMAVSEEWRKVSFTPAYPDIHKPLLPVFVPGALYAAPLAARAGVFFILLMDSAEQEQGMRALLAESGLNVQEGTDYEIRRLDKEGVSVSTAVEGIARRFPDKYVYTVNPKQPLRELFNLLAQEGRVLMGDYLPALQATADLLGEQV